MRKHLAVGVATLCAMGALVPATVMAVPTSNGVTAQAEATANYQKGQTITKDGITYEVLGVYGEDYSIDDPLAQLFQKGDIGLKITGVDAKAVRNGVIRIDGVVKLDNNARGRVYNVADGVLVNSGVKHVIPTDLFYMKSACLPEGADIVVPEQRKNLFGDKYFYGVTVVPYTLKFDTSSLTFDGGVGSSSQGVTASVEGLEGVVLDVTVDGSSVAVEKSSNGSYEVTPVACGDSKINVGLSLEGFDLPVIDGTRAATVNHVEDKGTVTVEPTYASEGKKEYRCKHCKTLLRTETVAKLDSIFEEGGVAYGQVGANSVEVIKSGTDQNANPLYADKDVVIPSQVTHGGKTYKVAGIGKSAFNPLTSASPKSIKIAEGVGYIGDGAFQAAKLASLIIPKTVTTIGASAFSTGQAVFFTSDVPPTISGTKLPDGVTAWYPASAKGVYEKALGIDPGTTKPENTFDLVSTGKVSVSVGSAPVDLPVKITKSDQMAVSYKSSNEAVATVDASGKVTPKSAGSAKVNVELTYGGIVIRSVEVEVSVSTPGSGGVGGGTVAPSDKTDIEKNPDGSTTTTVTKPDGSQTITHETATGTESVVTKDEDGNVTSTKVTVSSKDATIGKVELPIEKPKPVSDVDKAQSVEVKVPSSVTAGKPVQVTVPVAKAQGSEPNYGIVVFAVDEDGNETVIPQCSVDKDGNVVFEATGNVTIKVVDNARDMPDVADSDWFAGDVVDFATARGIVNGVDMPDGTKRFKGYDKTSRGMLVAMLHNLELNPEAASEDSLADVPENAFYADAAAWALEEGILSGVDMPDGSRRFQGDAAVTREQVAVFLMRYAERLGMDVSARVEIDFPDASEVSGFARDAMSWAVAEGIFKGDDATGELNPTDGAARAEVAAVLMRFISLMYA